jgi:hypothetical protein
LSDAKSAGISLSPSEDGFPSGVSSRALQTPTGICSGHDT